MKFLQEHQLRISTLTPVHIGCGEDYTPTNYVIDDDALYAFDSTAVAEALPENAKEQLRKVLQGAVQDDALRQIQKLFFDQREPLIAKAVHYLQIAPGVATLYQDRIGQVAQHEGQGERVINQLEIERTFYNPVSHRPVIPGSSLKGAIRTALLDSISAGESQRSQEKNRDLQQRLFKYQKFEQDPMRLIHLADTNEAKEYEIVSEIRFAVNRTRRDPKPGESIRTKAEKRNLYQLLETIPELSVRGYESCITIQDVGGLTQADKLPKANLRWTVEQIAKACNRFYLPLLQQELEIVKQRQYVVRGWEQRMQKLIEDVIKPLSKSNKAMLLRVGRHSGAEAVTLNRVRSIKIMGRNQGEDRQESKPRTLWLAADVQASPSEMVTFGWTLVEIDPSDKPHPMLEELSRQSRDQNRQWLEKQKYRVQELSNKIHHQKQREIEQEQKRVAEENAKKEREKAEQKRLALLSEEQRAIEELERWYHEDMARDMLRPQDRVPGRLSELLKKATDWPQESRMVLCDLAETIYRELEMLKGKKGRERKATIQKLRE